MPGGVAAELRRPREGRTAVGLDRLKLPEFFSPEEWEDIKTYPGWEELITPRIPASVSKEWRRH